ncbi:hypothetical protein EDB92DRAFT_1835966 [Lactarius akahatsu]|uniref:Uncharacterized protein n=1 Tax=Lactarius akahatsu TaxID=416441 RepID=A0AAD4LTJ4_9AGAM|nr:hypothetical protein EDB92DRAFT_1835966 [Lactarius akahatsu]
MSTPCGPSPTCGPQDFVCANSDVLGKGIRINFYYTMVLLAVVPRTPHTEELLNALYSNAGISGLGLLVTAIQQTASKQRLSLFHAIFIQHILFFLGTGSAPIGKYHWSKSRLVMGVFMQFASVIAFTGWALYMWIHVNSFGEEKSCNDQVKYVLMFVSVRATKPWLRDIWIATLVLSAVGLMIKFGYNAFTLFVLRHDEGEETEQPEKGWYFYISIPRILSAIYSAVMLELMVHRNSSDHGGKVIVDESWAFGQTLSVVMIFANMNEVIHFLFGYIARRRERSRELQAEAQQASDDTDVPPASTPYRPRGHPGSHLSTRDSAQMKLSSEYELSNLNKDNSHVSVNTVGEISQTRDQPVGTLR